MRHLWIVLVLFLASCAAPRPDEAREAQATAAYQALVSADDSALIDSLTPSARELIAAPLLAQMRSFAPSGPPPEPRTINWTWFQSGGLQTYELRQEYAYPDRTVQWSVQLVKEGSAPWLVNGIHINAIDAQTIAAARFSLAGRPVQNYLVLAGAVGSFLLCLTAAVLAGWRRRWAWMVGSLLGVGQVALNWSTGEVFFEVARVALFGAGFVKSGGVADPWIVSFAVPVFAILFFALRRWTPKPPKKRAGDQYRYRPSEPVEADPDQRT